MGRHIHGHIFRQIWHKNTHTEKKTDRRRSHTGARSDKQFLGLVGHLALNRLCTSTHLLTHVQATKGLEESTWQTMDNVAVDSQITDPQPAVNTGLFTGCRRAQNRCTWRQFVKTATLQAVIMMHKPAYRHAQRETGMQTDTADITNRPPHRGRQQCVVVVHTASWVLNPDLTARHQHSSVSPTETHHTNVRLTPT